ncbi:hypothetical protein EVAR_73251_1 [Eumeta japonica]|uniref:Uncharacterized protein n=1 Tax=Eumeta variegata TaxID=151549 RepID=A0A4C1SKB1_EUMVA|nr:hypothetical protein EVAR_73251_1 [Eumeta japonica]
MTTSRLISSGRMPVTMPGWKSCSKKSLRTAHNSAREADENHGGNCDRALYQNHIAPQVFAFTATGL